MITATRSRRQRPQVPNLLPIAARGVLSSVRHTTTFTAKTSIFDDFQSGLDYWVNVHGKLSTSGGDVSAPDSFIDYAAGYHRTELLSDNQRAKVTIGATNTGKARLVICADHRFQRYYGVEVETGIVNNKIHIIKGYSPIDVKKFETFNQTATTGAEVEVWFDEPESTIRVFYNDTERASLEVPAYEIQHGPGHRKTGVVMGVDWFLAPGVLFEDFSAWDV